MARSIGRKGQTARRRAKASATLQPPLMNAVSADSSSNLEACRPYLYRSLGRSAMSLPGSVGGTGAASHPAGEWRVHLGRIKVGPRIPDWECEGGGLHEGISGHAPIKKFQPHGPSCRNEGWVIQCCLVDIGSSYNDGEVQSPVPAVAARRQLVRRVFVQTPAYPNRECEAMRGGLFGLHVVV